MSPGRLPANAPVILGGGSRGTAYEVLGSALTGGDGTLRATVRVRGWAGGAEPFVFVVAGPERGVVARSEPFSVTGSAFLPTASSRP